MLLCTYFCTQLCAPSIFPAIKQNYTLRQVNKRGISEHGQKTQNEREYNFCMLTDKLCFTYIFVTAQNN